MSLVPISWAILLALAGIFLGYFFALIPIVILITTGVILLFLILRGPHLAESGIAALFMAIAVLLVMVPMFLTSVVVGTIPLLQFIYGAGQTIAQKLPGFNWSWLIRQ